MTRWILIASLLAACSTDQPKCDPDATCDTEEVEPVVIDDAGTACLLATTADAPATVEVVFEECASNCIENLVVSCTAELVDSDIVVTSTGTYDPPSEDVCDASCKIISTTCDTESLPAGTYNVVYGESVVAEIPGDGACATR